MTVSKEVKIFLDKILQIKQSLYDLKQFVRKLYNRCINKLIK